MIKVTDLLKIIVFQQFLATKMALITIGPQTIANSANLFRNNAVSECSTGRAQNIGSTYDMLRHEVMVENDKEHGKHRFRV